MKLITILTIFSLSIIVKGAWWAAAVQPVILGFGAAFAALDHDVVDTNFFGWRDFIKWIPWIGKEKQDD